MIRVQNESYINTIDGRGGASSRLNSQLCSNQPSRFFPTMMVAVPFSYDTYLFYFTRYYRSYILPIQALKTSDIFFLFERIRELTPKGSSREINRQSDPLFSGHIIVRFVFKYCYLLHFSKKVLLYQVIKVERNQFACVVAVFV